jgi:FG-GAP-like repeat
MRGTRFGIGLACAAVALTLGAGSRSAGAPPLLGDPTEFVIDSEPGGVAIGDLNGDHRPDLVATSDPADGQVVSVLLSRADGTYVRHDELTDLGPAAVAIGDLNRDGKPDLVTANQGQGNVSVLLNEGGGSFSADREYEGAGTPVSVAIRDLNGDRKPDLATANDAENSVSLLLNRGNGTFRWARELRTGRGPESVAVGDLNGDGRPDLVTANAKANTVSCCSGWVAVVSRPSGTTRRDAGQKGSRSVT